MKSKGLLPKDNIDAVSIFHLLPSWVLLVLAYKLNTLKLKHPQGIYSMVSKVNNGLEMSAKELLYHTSYLFFEQFRYDRTRTKIIY